MSHTNPKVTNVLLFMESISFLMKSSLDTDPAGGDVILWRNIRFRESIFEGSRFSPTIDSAMSERVEICRNTWLCYTSHEVKNYFPPQETAVFMAPSGVNSEPFYRNKTIVHSFLRFTHPTV